MANYIGVVHPLNAPSLNWFLGNRKEAFKCWWLVYKIYGLKKAWKYRPWS